MDAVTSPKKVGQNVYVGGATVVPPAGWVLVDVQDLPESPKTLAEIPLDRVKAKVKAVVTAVRAGKNVLVRCRMGVSRSPTIAKIALAILKRSYSDPEAWPNGAWRKVAAALNVKAGR